MNQKFKQGDTVMYKGEERTIMVSSKNFSTKKVSYKLDTDELVLESELETKGKKRTAKRTKKAKKDNIKLVDRLKMVKPFEEQMQKEDVSVEEFSNIIESMSDEDFEKFMANLTETEN